MNDGDTAIEVNASSIPTLAWAGLSVTVPLKSGHASIEVKDEETGDPVKPTTKTILSGVSGLAHPGTVLYIMGPSGSGKTTLLDALANRLRLPATGTQLLDGVPKTGRLLRSAAKYVQQTDDLLGALSVTESLSYSAALYNVPTAERSAVVADVVHALGLSGSSDTRVGTVFEKGLSGGQRRRLSIATELVARPRLLFLDEPTSGLDSAAAFHVMREVRQVAVSQHVAVVASIHQPSQVVFEMADNLLLLSAGKPAYFGPAREARNHFEAVTGTTKPSGLSDVEWILEAVNTDFGDDALVQRAMFAWPSSSAAAALNTDLSSIRPLTSTAATSSSPASQLQEHATGDAKPAPLSTQIAVLFKRGLLNALRNPAVLWLRLAMYVMLALMIGLVWLRLPTTAPAILEFNSAMFYSCAFMIFMSVSVLPAYLDERSVLARERANGTYGAPAYVLAHTLYEVPFIFILALVCSPIVYFLVGLTPTFSRFAVFTANLFVSLLVAESLMLLISAVVPILIVGISIGTMLFGLFMCVMGIFVPMNQVGWWIRWLKFPAMHYFSYSTFLVNQYRGVMYDAVPDNLFPPYPNDVPGESIYRQYGLEERIWVNFVAQIAMIVIYRLAATAWIHKFVKGKK